MRPRLTPLQAGLVAGIALLVLSIVFSTSSWIGSGAVPRVEPAPVPAAPAFEPGPVVEAPSPNPLLVARNPFSARRGPPDARWSPEEDGPRAAEPQPEVSEASRPRLLGTVVDGSLEGSFAVLEADPAHPGPELYEIGDEAGGYRVERIFHDKVVLSRDGRSIDVTLLAHPAHQERVARRSQERRNP